MTGSNGSSSNNSSSSVPQKPCCGLYYDWDVGGDDKIMAAAVILQWQYIPVMTIYPVAPSLTPLCSFPPSCCIIIFAVHQVYILTFMTASFLLFLFHTKSISLPLSYSVLQINTFDPSSFLLPAGCFSSFQRFSFLLCLSYSSIASTFITPSYLFLF